MKKYDIPEYVLRILSRLKRAGYEAYIVGGPVRDLLLGRSPLDWDIATSALPREVIPLFDRVLETGVRHGTVTVLSEGVGAEVTTFRKESAYSDFRHPDEVRFVSELKQDLSRRDFTVNAMAMTEEGRVIDYFGGVTDLELGLVRCVGDPKLRFSEDALRMLRALRFKAALGFEIEPGTLAALKECAPLASALSPERVRDELRKILISGSPETLESVIEYGLMNACLKPAPINLDGLSGLCGDESTRLCAFCFLLEKRGLITSPEAFLKELRFPARTVSLVKSAAAILKSGPPADEKSVKRLLAGYGGEAVSLAAGASFGEDFSRLLEKVISSGECWSLKQLEIGGADLEILGMRGVQVGEALSKLLEHVIECPRDNERNILLNMAKNQLNITLT